MPVPKPLVCNEAETVAKASQRHEIEADIHNISLISYFNYRAKRMKGYTGKNSKRHFPIVDE